MNSLPGLKREAGAIVVVGSGEVVLWCVGAACAYRICGAVVSSRDGSSGVACVYLAAQCGRASNVLQRDGGGAVG